MAVYNFLKESSVFIVHGGSRYRIYTTPEVSISQTFAEDSYTVKTLHDQTKMFEGTTITKANPANFSFGVYLTEEKDETIVKSLLTEYDTSSGEQLLKTFDLYIVSTESAFKIENCHIKTGDFLLNVERPLTLNVSGQGEKLTRVGDSTYTVPGSVVSSSATYTPTTPVLDVEIGGTDVPNLVNTTLSVQNNTDFKKHETLQNSLSVTNKTNAMYPSGFSLDNRIVSGNITQFVTSTNSSDFFDFSTNSSIAIKTLVNGTTFFNANLSGCMFTKRLQTGQALQSVSDFRLATSPANLNTIITY
tara:strand:+ start:1292 stop:2200 length:909 start_codon:yes stop_codon:yes gene_type:complete